MRLAPPINTWSNVPTSDGAISQAQFLSAHNSSSASVHTIPNKVLQHLLSCIHCSSTRPSRFPPCWSWAGNIRSTSVTGVCTLLLLVSRLTSRFVLTWSPTTNSSCGGNEKRGVTRRVKGDTSTFKVSVLSASRVSE